MSSTQTWPGCHGELRAARTERINNLTHHFYGRLRTFASAGKPFTFTELRDALGVGPADKAEKNRLWNWFRAARKEEIVEEVELNRARNKYYKVVKRDMLDGLAAGQVAQGIDKASTSKARPSANGGTASQKANPISFSGPDRLTRIEEAQTAMKQTLDEMAARQQDIERKLDQKLDHLIGIWH